MKKTKIICTIGPSSSSYEMLVKLVEKGMNIARLNFSHGSHAMHLEVIKTLKKVREDLKCPLAIMLDNKGPEVRLGKLQNGKISLKKKDRIFLTSQENIGPSHLPINPPHILKKLEKGIKVLFDDGYITSEIVEVKDDGVIVEIENDGDLFDHKGVNIPGFALDLPTLTEQDKLDIKFGVEQDIDFIAASFIRSDEDILEIKRYLAFLGKPEILIIAKIESFQGIQNFDHILSAADGIMVARGDLGVEVPLSQVPRLQKEMIHKCFKVGKPAITATQMLESMIHNPRPTRAEVSDVANAIYDSTSCVMLSGETAVGQYPLEAVQVLKEVIEETEAYFDYRQFFYQHMQNCYHDVPAAVTSATVNTAYCTEAKAIFVFSSTGHTSRLISRWRCATPIIVLTNNLKVYHQLSLNWGIIPLCNNEFKTIQEASKIVTNYAIEQKIVSIGDIVVVTSGSQFGVSGSTNMMQVENIGDVLIRAGSGYGSPVSANITKLTHSKLPKDIKDKIIVVHRCDDSYLDLLKQSKGIILDNHPEDVDSEKYAILVGKTLNIAVVTRAKGAIEILKEGQLVTIDPKVSLVYDGTITL